MKQFTFSDQLATKPNDKYWQFCVGSGHAALAHRADYQKQLKRAHDELGFERVRFHGVFDEDMNVIETLHSVLPLPGSKKVQTHSFYQIACVYDALLEMGVRPFVEIGFMPKVLASGKRSVFYYKGNVTPPKDQKKWAEFIKSFIRFLLNRYGKEEVENWYFEVWNEPDLRGFFWTGSQEDYFKLYQTTVTAIKSVDPALRVGGPSTSQNRWVSQMREYCEKKKLPLDFLSTHHYPGDDVGLPLFTWKNLSRILFAAKRNPGKSISETYHIMMYRKEILPLIRKDSMLRQAKEARREAGSLPLFYTEWNVNPTCTAPLHDTTQSSAFVVKHIMDCQYVMNACSFWCFSDIFEESSFFPEPFTGSFGLMNIYGIPKPSYWAFFLLNRLGEERFDLPATHEEIELAAFRSKDAIQVLLYRQSYVQENKPKEPVRVTIKTGRQAESVQRWRIDQESGNPIRLWKEMGKPKLLSKAQAKEIEERSAVRPEVLEFGSTDGSVCVETELAVNDVQLLVISLK